MRGFAILVLLALALGLMIVLVGCGDSAGTADRPAINQNPVVPALTETAVALQYLIGEAEVNRAATSADIPSLTIIQGVDSLDPQLPQMAVWRTENSAFRVHYPPNWAALMGESSTTITLAENETAADALGGLIAGEAIRSDGVALQIGLLDPTDGPATALAIAQPIHADLANNNQTVVSDLVSTTLGAYDATTFTVTRSGQIMRYSILVGDGYGFVVMAVGDDTALIEAILAALQIAPTPPPTD